MNITEIIPAVLHARDHGVDICVEIDGLALKRRWALDNGTEAEHILLVPYLQLRDCAVAPADFIMSAINNMLHTPSNQVYYETDFTFDGGII